MEPSTSKRDRRPIHHTPMFWIGIALILAGIVIRAVAIATLWRFFTVTVAIHESHELIDRGLYRIIGDGSRIEKRVTDRRAVAGG